MKKIMLATAVSCLLISSVHAAVDKPEGWYFKGSYDNLFANSKYHNLSALGGSVGYKQGFFRGEGYLGYARVRETLRLKQHYGLHSKGNNFNFGLHGFLDLDNPTLISPYVGLGVEKNTYNSIFVKHTDHVKGVGLAGARAYLTNNFALDMGYKTDLSRLKKGGATTLGLVYHF